MELNQICVETKTRWLEQKRGIGQLQLINVVLTEITSSLNRWMMETFSLTANQSPLNSRSLVDFKQAGIRRAREPSRESCQQIIHPTSRSQRVGFYFGVSSFYFKTKTADTYLYRIQLFVEYDVSKQIYNREILRLANQLNVNSYTNLYKARKGQSLTY